MKLSTTTLGCPDWDLATILRNLGVYGYDAVDFRGLQGEMKIWLRPEFRSDIADTAKRIVDAGLAVSCISSGIRLTQASPSGVADVEEELLRTAELCATLDCPSIRVFGGQTDGLAEDATEEQRRRTIDTTAERCAHLARRAREIAPVDILIETHDAWIASRDIADLLSAVGRDDVGCLWDIKHTWWMVQETAATTWERIRPWVRNTHWKDVAHHLRDGDPGHPAGRYVPQGEGIMPGRDALDLMQRDGYDGYHTLEWEKKWHPEIAEPDIAFPRFVEYMRGL